MKVFYVMVLVLVAGAVPSHGRTESEGTLFNRTQSHESMNNVTASNGMLVTSGSSYLVMQWPRSFCKYGINQIPCYSQNVPGYFTVHGLWPQWPQSRRAIFCTDRGIYGRHPLFDSRKVLYVYQIQQIIYI